MKLPFLVVESSDNMGDIFYNSDESDDDQNDLHGNNGSF